MYTVDVLFSSMASGPEDVPEVHAYISTHPLGGSLESSSVSEDLLTFSFVLSAQPSTGDEAVLVSDVQSFVSEPAIKFNHPLVWHTQNRVYCYTDLRWVGFNQQYGANLQNMNLNLGTNPSPNLDWDASGVLLPKNTKLERILIKGRCNSAQVTSLQLCVRSHETDFSLDSAIDSNAEVNTVEVLPPTDINLDPGLGNSADMRIRSLSLGGYVTEFDTDIHIYLKPLGSPTTTRYFYASMALIYRLST